ncbi:hypothetical protein ABZ916_44340 [Streptomyces sp. NPDC046853]|uniref:hypothetical protein n=1 Tax=Streptomyces sp. NPDC046853 TaxID=3154920 RepID=UPI0033ECC52C
MLLPRHDARGAAPQAQDAEEVDVDRPAGLCLRDVQDRVPDADPRVGDDDVDGGSFYRVRREGYESSSVPDAGEGLDEVCNVDMWVIRAGGERWSGTVFTLDEVHRIMARQRQTGEPEGDYWWCWDGLIVRDIGVPSMVKVIDRLVATGEYETVLRHVGPEVDL